MKNKEIEELLNDIKSYLSKKPFTQDITNVITLNEFKKLLSYIEQLENNRDKAIEILSGSYCTYDDVIKILKGDSDE